MFNIPNVILMLNVFSDALDEATFCPWWLLTDLISNKRKQPVDFAVESFTLEMGSQEVISFQDGKYDAKSILTYLTAKGCLPGGTILPENMSRNAVTLNNYKTLFTQQGGIVEYIAKPGDIVKRGGLLARLLNVDNLDTNKATTDIYLPVTWWLFSIFHPLLCSAVPSCISV